jgi:signal transduction histidine kinase
VRRIGSEQISQMLDSNRWLAGVLRGERSAGEAVSIDGYADNPTALLYAHVNYAVAAAIFGDPVGLTYHTAAAMPLLPAVPGQYPIALARLLRGLALAGQARDADSGERAALLSELDEVTQWLATRAADSPDNFLHLLRLLEAERARALGDFRAAALAFDTARREAAQRQRPWHRALITERAARFYLAHGLEHAGYNLLTQARQDYFAWGATAKVAQLDWAYPTLRPQPDATSGRGADQPDDLLARRSTVTTGTIDLLGILSASQALSSETSVEGLHARVVDVLSEMTGATGIHLLLWNDDRQDWVLPARVGDAVPVNTPGRERAVPMSVLRYAERLREPLVVSDATADDRFARDPYFTDVDCCALLALPILNRGTLQALLLLENRLIRGAFTAERLDAVKLIAGQLAISYDHAHLYAQFRRIADEQAALRRVATLVAEGGSPTAVFDAVAAEMERLVDADRVTLGRYEPGEQVTVVADRRGPEAYGIQPGMRISHEGENVTTIVRRTERPARIDYAKTVRGVIADVTRGRGTRVAVGAPIVVECRLWGVISAAWSGEELPPAGIEDRMALCAQLLGTAIANADSRAQLTASRARLLAAGDEARRKVARDLHDGAQQQLVLTVMTLLAAREALAENDGTADTLIGDALEQVEQATVEVRELAHGMLPGVLTGGGLKAAVNAVARRLDLPVQVDVPAGRFAPGIEASAYFIVAEALTNVVKHADATRAEVRAAVADGTLRVEVRDDGVGGADPGGHGLVGIGDRAIALGGRLDIQSPPGGGTLVAATLPLAHAPPSTDTGWSDLPDYS